MIREMLLNEAAYTPDTVPEDVTFKLVVKQGGLFSTITASTGEGSSLIGGVRAARALSDRSEEPCFDGFEVALSNAAQGLGPLLYDIVMEVASEIGGGLYSDRSEVSREARNIWNYYDSNRPDVQKFEMDSPQNERTPDLYDNCDIELVKSEMGENEWWRDPLAKIYVKKGSPTIKRLLQLGKIEIVGWRPK